MAWSAWTRPCGGKRREPLQRDTHSPGGNRRQAGAQEDDALGQSWGQTPVWPGNLVGVGRTAHQGTVHATWVVVDANMRASGTIHCGAVDACDHYLWLGLAGLLTKAWYAPSGVACVVDAARSGARRDGQLRRTVCRRGHGHQQAVSW